MRRDSTILVHCEQCRQKYALPRESAGQRKRCRRCGTMIHVPWPEAPRTSPKPVLNTPKRRVSRLRWFSLGAAAAIAIVGIALLVSWSFEWIYFGRPTTTLTSQFERPDPHALLKSDFKSQSERIFHTAVGEIVFIYTFDEDSNRIGHGSGFFLNPGDKVVTNWHVIDGADHVIVETYWRQRFRVDRRLARDEHKDLAILPVPVSIKTDGLQLSKRSHSTGEAVFAIGSPREKRFILTQGVITRIGQFMALSRGMLVECDISADPGSSGCPLLDNEGQVLGVMSRGSHVTTKFTQSVHASEIIDLIERGLQEVPFSNE